LYDALAIPSAEPVTGEGESEGDSETEPTDSDKKTLPEIFAEAMKQARHHGYTNDEIVAELSYMQIDLAS
jgi:hypothetical protein